MTSYEELFLQFKGKMKPKEVPLIWSIITRQKHWINTEKIHGKHRQWINDKDCFGHLSSKLEKKRNAYLSVPINNQFFFSPET